MTCVITQSSNRSPKALSDSGGITCPFLGKKEQVVTGAVIDTERLNRNVLSEKTILCGRSSKQCPSYWTVSKYSGVNLKGIQVRKAGRQNHVVTFAN